MDLIKINGGKPLSGEIEISGAKNAALPIMAACLLTDQPVQLTGVPDLRDIDTMGRLLGQLGAAWGRDPFAGTMDLQAAEIKSAEAHYKLVKTMRASVLVLGPLVARHGWARVSLPGGCAIGARPINLHLDALEKMGAQITLQGGYVHAACPKLQGADVFFDRVTVTGTENIVMAAALAQGRTIIRNAAREPEVTDLCRALISMGAVIEGLGTDVLTVDGVDSLGPLNYRIMPDRIETGTYLAAAAATKSKLTLTGCRPDSMDAVLDKFRDAGVKITAQGDRLLIDAANGPLQARDCRTRPYPGFPTDMQAQFMAAMCLARGTSVINETIFENRFMHVPELLRMGADIQVEGSRAVIKGAAGLSGAPVMATDLRASASLVVAGLAAEGETVIRRVYHLDRGYQRMEEKLSAVGADIWREKE